MASWTRFHDACDTNLLEVRKVTSKRGLEGGISRCCTCDKPKSKEEE